MAAMLTLSEILSRQISVECHEGIAVVRGVVERVVARPSRSPDVPELHQIQISDDGRIEMLGTTRTDEPVRRLGQLLQATLVRSDPPVQVRLVIAQATAPMPAFGSVQDFDRALEYFERPDRVAVLRGLYLRAAAAEPLPDAASELTLDTIAPRTKLDEPARAPKRDAGPMRRVRRLLAAAAFLLIAGVVGLRYARTDGVALGTGDVSGIAKRVTDSVGGTVLSGLSAVTERAGLGRLIERDSAAAEPEAAAPPPSSEPRPASPRAARANGTPIKADPQTPPFVAFDLGPAAVPSPPPAPDIAVAPPPVDVPERSEDVRDVENELPIYSSDSIGVSPPVGVRPQLPEQLPPNIRKQDLLSIELVVLPDGTVDSVKLMAGPRHVHDIMWLSAVKAFEFRPALKDGVPVKYRKTVWIASE